MIERHIEPVVRVVTDRAIGREVGCHMIFCSGILRLMARITFGFRCSDGSNMAIRTLHNGRMASGKRKTGCCVVERRRLPRCSGVAGFTINRQPGLAVAWCLRVCIICLVTTVAISWSSNISGSVALGAGNCCVSAGQRKVGFRVIEAGL